MNPPFPLSGTMQHPQLGQVKYELTEVSDDPDTQVAQVISLMKRYAIQDAASPALLRDVSAAYRSEDPIQDTWDYLRRHGARGMRFVRDEQTGAPFERSQGPGGWRPVVETLMRPVDQAITPVPQGDCDDFAMYGAAHLRARGVPSAFATVAADEREPNVYSHVYLIAYPVDGPHAGQRVPLDLSHGPYPGWEVPNQFQKFQEWPVESGISLFIVGLLAAGSILLYRALSGRPN